MCFNRKKGFSLIEVMIVMGIVSLILAIAAPIFTKRMRGSQSSGCIGGTRAIKKLYLARYDVKEDENQEQAFVVPDNIKGDVTFTMVGAGGGGGSGYGMFTTNRIAYDDVSVYSTPSIVDTSTCTLNLPANDGNGADFVTHFYSNVTLNAVGIGGKMTAPTEEKPKGAPGKSGKYIYNEKIAAKPNCTYSYYVSAYEYLIETCSGKTNVISLSSKVQKAIAGETGEDGVPDYLSGGYPRPFIFLDGFVRGVGQGCVWDGTKCSAGLARTSAACQITYKRAFAGQGGGGGAYAKFSLNLPKNTECKITVGRGGKGGTAGSFYQDNDTFLGLTISKGITQGSATAGGDTVITCGDDIYKAGGGGIGVVNAKPSLAISDNGGVVNGNFPNNSLLYASGGQNGEAPLLDSTISGGSGGVAWKKFNTPYSEAAKGGCYKSSSSYSCSDSQGQNGTSPSSDLRHAGSGGGGGSCDDDRCGGGGFGADGIVIVEYKTKCY